MRSRTRTRLAAHDSPHAPRDLLDILPPELIGFLLRTCTVKELCSLAACSRALAETHVPSAVQERCALLGYALPPLLMGESVLHALRFIEMVAERPRCTMAGDTCHTICIRPEDGVTHSFGGHERPADPDAPDDDDDIDGPSVRVSHLGHGHALGHRVGIPTPMAGLHAVQICEVAAGYEHSLLLSRDGHVYSCGIGEFGRLGHGWDATSASEDTGRAGMSTTWMRFECLERSQPRRIQWGFGHTAGQTVSTPQAHAKHWRHLPRHLYACWRHEPSVTSKAHAPAVLEAVVQVAAGGFQSGCLTSDGRVWTWGWGDSGSLGHGIKEHLASPTVIACLVDDGQRITQMSAGSAHSLYVSEEGALFATGDRSAGKLGLGLMDADAPPEQLTPARVRFGSARTRIRQASAWHAHSLAVSTAGGLYSFGNGGKGRLGHGDQLSQHRPKKVRALAGKTVAYAAAGEVHSVVLTCDGQALAFGDPIFGQLGNGWTAATGIDAYKRPTPVLLPRSVGRADLGTLQLRPNVAEIACGDHHTLVRLTSGEVFTFGLNANCQLGLTSAGETFKDALIVRTPTQIAWTAVPPGDASPAPTIRELETEPEE